MEDPFIQKVLQEKKQAPETRQTLLESVEEELGRTILSFFTSFNQPGLIEDDDADILEAVLQKTSIENGLILLISSPGGLGLTAERIIRICRRYSGTDDYWAVVPSKAKSAATMICLGASKIMMGETAELGPIDPQVSLQKEGFNRCSVYNIIETYDNLFEEAVNTNGNIEPYLQQLENYDERIMQEFRQALSLSEDIAAKALLNGMMEDYFEGENNIKEEEKSEEIKEKLEKFLKPEETKSHGRPIFAKEASNCGLNVETLKVDSDLWDLIYEIYVRTNQLVSTTAVKCIETKDHSFIASKGE